MADGVAKKKIYVETSIISYLAARPSASIQDAARQLSTHEWWENESRRYDLYVSQAVWKEASRGDADAAARRMKILDGMSELTADDNALMLATAFIEGHAVPKEYPDDALHIAIAAVGGMDYLLSWNFKHITNADTIPIVQRICLEKGYRCPMICTPQMMRREDAT